NLVITSDHKIVKKLKFQNETIHIGKLNDHQIWISFFSGGVAFYDHQGNELRRILKDKHVTCLYSDDQGGYWIGTLFSGVYHIKNIDVQQIQLSSDNGVSELQQTEYGTLWIAQNNGDICYFSNNQLNYLYHSKTGRPSHVHYDVYNH